MAEFGRTRGKRQEDSGLGSVLDLLLANARLVLGVTGAAVLAIATLAVKRLIDRATSPRDESDPKAEQKTLEESWQDLALIKATPKPPKKQRREDLSEPLLSPARPPVPDPCACRVSHPDTGLVPFYPVAQEKLARLRPVKLVMADATSNASPAASVLHQCFLLPFRSCCLGFSCAFASSVVALQSLLIRLF